MQREPRNRRLKPPYKGRFAPSPTGSLHFGSLTTAVASYLQAKANSGEWYLRIEDLDPHREIPGAAQQIIQTLEDFGFEWDGPIIYQSSHHSLYAESLASLLKQNKAYYCGCSRKEVEQFMATHNDSGTIYPGICRHKGEEYRPNDAAIRLLSCAGLLSFTDKIQGEQQTDFANELGDFVIYRRDGLYAYQLAVVIDDAIMGINEVVRGVDLLQSTFNQICLQRYLNLSNPKYLHIPICVDNSGRKISKQDGAQPILKRDATPLIFAVLALLGQNPPIELKSVYRIEEVWKWAVKHWNAELIPKVHKITI